MKHFPLHRTGVVLTAFTLLTTCFAAAPADPAHPLSATGFEENKGQVRSSDGTEASYVRYRLVQGDTRIFLLNSGIAFQFCRTHFPDGFAEAMKSADADPQAEDAFRALSAKVERESFRMDMTLEGADPDAQISTSGASSDYVQYYRYGALDVHRYEQVTYHEVYPGIDWVIHTTKGRHPGAASGVKYDFVLQPGADPAQIRLAFTHQEELRVDASGKLIHGNRMGRFVEQRPVSYQDGREVPTAFVLEGNTLRFEVGKYDPSLPLTIDPDRIWGTYYGGSSLDFGWATAVDNADNVYLSGHTASEEGIAMGGYQNEIAWDFDAFLVKFAADGTRLWATYYGGISTENAHGVAVDSDGNVFLAGTTGSEADIAFNGYQNTGGGSNDAFLAKFNSAGVRQWATYYGGAQHEVGRNCAVDAANNVYLTGGTKSSSAIAMGGHQNSHGGGNYDAFLVKFAPDGTRLWGTYYGGSVDDQGNSCVADGTDVYLTGFAGPGDIASGGQQNTYGGGDRDGFLVKFNSAGTRLWGTYYGGSEEEEGMDVAVDPSGDVILSGYTTSTSGIATAGAHQETYGGGARDAMLIKFNSSGVRQWATYFGGDENDLNWTCAVDASGGIAIGGITESTSAIALNGFQMTIGGNEDIFLAYFDPNGTQVWGTYYGGNNDDDAYGSAFDASGNCYISGTTRSHTDIAYEGFQNAYGGEYYDGFLVKFGGMSVGVGTVPPSAGGLRWLGQQGSIHTVLLGDFRPVQLDLLDASGRMVMAIPVSAGQDRISVDLGGLAPGGYVLRTRDSSTQAVVRLMHQ